MPHVAQEGDEAWPDSGAPLRQRPQDPQPGRTCPWGPGLGREAGRAGARARPPRATSESRTASPCLSFLSPEARAGEHPQGCPRAGVLHVAPLELVRSIYQGRLAPTTFQVRTTLRAGQGRAGGPARRGALQAPTRDRTQGVGDRITKRTLAAHSGEYSGRDGGGRGWARRWRWRGVGGARAGDGQAEPAAWAGRAGRRSRPARDIGGWAGLAPSPTPEARASRLLGSPAVSRYRRIRHTLAGRPAPRSPRTPVLLTAGVTVAGAAGRHATHSRGRLAVLGAGARGRGAGPFPAGGRVLARCPVPGSRPTTGTALGVLTGSHEGANLSSLGPGPRPCDLVGLRHLSKGSISKHRLIGLGLRRVDLGDGSVRNTCPFPRHPSLEPSVPQAPRQLLHASPGAGGSGGGAGDRAHPRPSGPRPLAGQARPHGPLRWRPDPGECRVPGQHAGLGAQPRGGPGTQGPTVAAGPLPWSAVREGRPRGPLHSPRPDADSSAWSRARGWSSWSPLARPCGC